MAYLTSLGWMMALPIGFGIVLGRVLDEHLGSGFFWTVTLFGAGLAIAVLELVQATSDALRRMHHE